MEDLFMVLGVVSMFYFIATCFSCMRIEPNSTLLIREGAIILTYVSVLAFFYPQDLGMYYHIMVMGMSFVGAGVVHSLLGAYMRELRAVAMGEPMMLPERRYHNYR